MQEGRYESNTAEHARRGRPGSTGCRAPRDRGEVSRDRHRDDHRSGQGRRKGSRTGTYESRLLDERPNLTGAASNAQRVVELHQNGKIIAKEVAEVFGLGERPVGTSGTTGRMGKATVQAARGRVSAHLDQRRRRPLPDPPADGGISEPAPAAGAVARRGATGGAAAPQPPPQ